MHGYDLRRHLRDDFGVLANLSFGSLYPALGRLETAGAIRTVAASPADEAHSEGPVLLTGSLGGERAATVARRATARVAETLGRSSTRARKVYEITSRGEELFEQLLQTPVTGESDQRGFSLRLAFARYLSPQARIRLLERRRMDLTDHLQRSAEHLERPTRTLDAYERSLAEHAREAVANDLAWIERLLELERARSSAQDDDRHMADIRDSEERPRGKNTPSTQSNAAEDAAYVHDGGISA